MKKLFIVLAFAFTLSGAPAYAQNHPDVVVSVKNTLIAQGISLADSCGAFQITKRVAWALRSEGAGLLDKPSGNNCQGFAVDIIMYPSGRIFDILTDSGASNGPSWNPIEPTDPSRYRPAFDPGDNPFPSPIPVPVPAPAPAPVLDLTPIYLRLDNLYAQAERIFAAQEAEAASERSAAQEHQALLVQHVAETRSFFAKVGGFFTDGKTIAAIVGGLATFVATTQAK